jgi:hypothetical protein
VSLDARHSRLIFSDIIRGFTNLQQTSFGKIFIKHLNNLDLADIEYWHNHYFEECIKNGIPTYDEKVEFLIKENLWDKKKEEKLKEYKKLLSQYEINKSSEYLISKRKMWESQLEPLRKDIKKIEIEKSSLISDTADGIASKRSNELHILKTFYKDQDFITPLFTEEEFNQMEQDKVNEIYDIFNEYMINFNADNLKRISLSNFFLNMFHLAPESVTEFYGKSVIYLSFYQIDLMLFGRYFRSVMQEMGDKIPNDVKGDPDKILEYVELNKNYKKMFPDEKVAESQTLVGATKEDLAILGMAPTASNSLNRKLKEKGGKLDVFDIESLT